MNITISVWRSLKSYLNLSLSTPLPATHHSFFKKPFLLKCCNDQKYSKIHSHSFFFLYKHLKFKSWQNHENQLIILIWEFIKVFLLKSKIWKCNTRLFIILSTFIKKKKMSSSKYSILYSRIRSTHNIILWNIIAFKWPLNW